MPAGHGATRRAAGFEAPGRGYVLGAEGDISLDGEIPIATMGGLNLTSVYKPSFYGFVLPALGYLRAAMQAVGARPGPYPPCLPEPGPKFPVSPRQLCS